MTWKIRAGLWIALAGVGFVGMIVTGQWAQILITGASAAITIGLLHDTTALWKKRCEDAYDRGYREGNQARMWIDERKRRKGESLEEGN